MTWHVEGDWATNGDASVKAEEKLLVVNVVQGSGYMKEHVTTYIPLDVLIQVLAARGLSVTRNSGEMTR